MTPQQIEAMKLALEALKWSKPHEDAVISHSEAITAIEEALAQPEQNPVAWPCLIDSADFSENTITLAMQCEDYKVSAGTHWLSTTPPQRKPLTDEQIFEIGQRHWLSSFKVEQIHKELEEAAHGIKENT